MGFLSKEEIEKIGFLYIGTDVKISDKASIYGASKISIDNNSRIDDFCVLSAGVGGIKIGKFVHIAVYCSLIGQDQIVIEDFAGISSKCAIYSSTDDFSGNYLTGPCVDSKFTNVIHGDVIIEKHSVIGAGTIILPNVVIGNGSSIGAMSLITKSIPRNKIAFGIPAVPIKNRKENIYNLEKEFLKYIENKTI